MTTEGWKTFVSTLLGAKSDIRSCLDETFVGLNFHHNGRVQILTVCAKNPSRCRLMKRNGTGRSRSVRGPCVFSVRFN